MSHQPPHGPPPPYGYPTPPGVAYVPAPVMMPVYPPAPAPPPPQPTYVTNYYYPPEQAQPQPQPMPMPVERPLQRPFSYSKIEKAARALCAAQRKFTKPDIDWVSATTATAASYSGRAYVAGREGWDGSPLWVIRAHHNGEFIPGKLAPRHKAAYVAHAGKEVPVHSFEILLAKPYAVHWVASNYGQVPPGAIAAGNTHAGEPLYIARVSHQNSITPGKVHPSHQCAYISFSGSELSFKHYDVLCKVGG
ncbi:vegetative cell wall protein gp1-like isoform X1 [Ostrinia furnacalis]|uniref:vegetative cell wall protein gp1-like isoform X1 n=1 Tax=Ostrinia furnacalis TaxID=93504 RepID=UPI00103E5C0C|nr:vegetative cell wall protein gp1-like isoform X1 [Ostrinia furnacalis]